MITKEYALLASDRKLTYAEGSFRGQEKENNACKLISLCNICGIGYSGLSEIEGSPTHEWVAKTLASANCRDPDLASRVLAEQAGRALLKVDHYLRRQIFLIAGWGHFDKAPGLRSHFCVITNVLDQKGRVLNKSRESFDRRIRALGDNEEFLWYSIGQSLNKERAQELERNLRRLVARDIGPKEALRLLVDEIVHTHGVERCATVGNKVLGFCIPRRSVEAQLRTGHSMALARFPDENSVAFVYFDPKYSELRQYGPTFVCGEFAATDIETENDQTRDFQSSQMRLLSLPKRKT